MTYWHTNNLYQKTPKGFFRGTLWSQFDQTRHGFNPGWKAQGHRNGQDHKDLRPSDKEQIEPGNSNLEKMVALVARVNQWLIEIGALDLQEGLQFFLSETQTIHQMSIAHMWEHTRCSSSSFGGGRNPMFTWHILKTWERVYFCPTVIINSWMRHPPSSCNVLPIAMQLRHIWIFEGWNTVHIRCGIACQ